MGAFINENYSAGDYEVYVIYKDPFAKGNM